MSHAFYWTAQGERMPHTSFRRHSKERMSHTFYRTAQGRLPRPMSSKGMATFFIRKHKKQANVAFFV